MARKLKRPKPVKVHLIERDKDDPACPYRVLDAIREDFHKRLKGAKIAIAWALGWKADRDGRMKLGQAKKATDLDRQMHAFDFVILLNSGAWFQFSHEQRAALMDHELCHCAIVEEDGGPKRDEQGRTVYRIRKHDVEEFTEIMARHGCWKKDLEAFARTCVDKYKTPLFDGNGKARRGRGRSEEPCRATK